MPGVLHRHEFVVKERRPEAIVLPYEPMLARLVHTIPTTEDWSWEIKWDGFRTALICDKKTVTFRSRNGTDMTSWFPELQNGMRAQLNLRSGILDGEIITGVGDVKSFNVLLRRARSRGRKSTEEIGLTFVAFDVLQVNGRDARDTPIEGRRDILRGVVSESQLLALSRTYNDGRALFAEAQRGGLEGVVGKKVGSLYVAGRSPLWIKAKVPGVSVRHDWHG